MADKVFKDVTEKVDPTVAYASFAEMMPRTHAAFQAALEELEAEDTVAMADKVFQDVTEEIDPTADKVFQDGTREVDAMAKLVAEDLRLYGLHTHTILWLQSGVLGNRPEKTLIPGGRGSRKRAGLREHCRTFPDFTYARQVKKDVPDTNSSKKKCRTRRCVDRWVHRAKCADDDQAMLDMEQEFAARIRERDDDQVNFDLELAVITDRSALAGCSLLQEELLAKG